MAYPPDLPPSTRTDYTIAAGNHADDHNALTLALTALVEELGASPSGSYTDLSTRLLGISSGQDQAAIDAFNDAVAAVVDVSNIDTSDDLVATLVLNNLIGPKTRAALATRYARVYTPEEFGAAGDGVTDDTDTINDCLASAAATGGVVKFAQDATYVTTGIVLHDPARKVRLEGYGAIITAPSDTTPGPLIEVRDGAGRTTVEGLEVTGTVEGSSTELVRVVNSRRSMWRNLRLNYGAVGYRFLNDGDLATAYNEDNNVWGGGVNCCTIAIEYAKTGAAPTDSFAANKWRDVVISNCGTHVLVNETCNAYRNRFEGLTHFFGQTSGHIIGYEIRGRCGGTIIDVAAEGTSANTDNQLFKFTATATRTQTLRIRMTLSNNRFLKPYIEDLTSPAQGKPAMDLTVITTDYVPQVTFPGQGGKLGFFGAEGDFQQAGVPKTLDGIYSVLVAHGLIPALTTVAITESFNTADGDTLGPALGWTETNGDLDIVSNQVKGSGSFGEARCTNPMGTRDHYAQVKGYKNGATTSTNYVQVQARGLGDGTRTHYLVRLLANNTYQVYKRVGGATTSLQTGAIAWADGDTLRIEVQGTTIKGLLNGTPFATLTNADLTTGVYTGIGVGGTVCAVDDFAAGDL